MRRNHDARGPPKRESERCIRLVGTQSTWASLSRASTGASADFPSSGHMHQDTPKYIVYFRFPLTILLFGTLVSAR